MNIPKIIAIATSFNPDIDILDKVIQALKNQVSEIIIIDDCSTDNEIENIIKQLESKYQGFVTFLRNKENSGIGYSLNIGAKIAIEKGAEWIITLDDDTILEEDTIKIMMNAYNEQTGENKEKIALITPNIKDIRNLIWDKNSPVTITNDGGITGGQMVKTQVLPIVGFWNEGLFIDDIDGEFCYRIEDAGYKTLNIPQAIINVRWGHPQLDKLFNRIVIIPNYPTYRYYYMARNHFYLYVRNFKKYMNWKRRKTFLFAIIIPRYLIKAILYEDHKITKIYLVIKGACDGLRGKLGKMK